ncbi:hypothetical protein [Lacinutrix neustonica]|uniref:hypothetical protein n=1 Tax=Lacinutrix neustonica TaxID=2980107 RepID=UPI0028BEE574|nr:hypothetical protein [Lacinutrix neustonica]
MKSLIILSILTLIGSCAETKYTTKIENLQNGVLITDSLLIEKYSKTITAEELKTNLYAFASENFQGRGVGEEGRKKHLLF